MIEINLNNLESPAVSIRELDSDEDLLSPSYQPHPDS